MSKCPMVPTNQHRWTIHKGGTDSVPGPARAVPLSGTLGRAGPLFIDYSYLRKLNKTDIYHRRCDFEHGI